MMFDLIIFHPLNPIHYLRCAASHHGEIKSCPQCVHTADGGSGLERVLSGGREAVQPETRAFYLIPVRTSQTLTYASM